MGCNPWRANPRAGQLTAVFKPHPITIGVGAPSFADVVAVARHDAPVALSAEALQAITEDAAR